MDGRWRETRPSEELATFLEAMAREERAERERARKAEVLRQIDEVKRRREAGELEE
jgi:hypothetical protein